MIKEILQIKIYHPVVPFFEIPGRLRNCRMATSPRSKSVAVRVKLRLVQRLEYLSHGFLYRPVDYVGDVGFTLHLLQ